MGNLINGLSLLGWFAVIGLAAYKFLQNPFIYFRQDISNQIELLTIVQGFQILDIILILFRKTQDSLLGTFVQVSGRLAIAWHFLEFQTNRYYFFLMTAMWSIGDILRYIYYLNKNEIAGLLRYNNFIIISPIGLYGQMKVINDYIRRHASTLSVTQIGYIRIIQVIIIFATICLYIYLLKIRNKFNEKLQQESKLASDSKAKVN